jgi:3-methyladenine DNA glycosylase Mpg
MALALEKQHNGADMCVPPLYIEDAPAVPTEQIFSATRIGVDYAGDWKKHAVALLHQRQPYVSVKAKTANHNAHRYT